MTDLIRLATEFERCGGQHRFAALMHAATSVLLRHERGETGVGMSDGVVLPEFTCSKCNARGHLFVCSTPGCPVNSGAAHSSGASGTPERTGLHGGPPGYPSMRGVSTGSGTGPASKLTGSAASCAYSDCQDEARITHAPDSPMRRVPRFAAPIEEDGE